MRINFTDLYFELSLLFLMKKMFWTKKLKMAKKKFFIFPITQWKPSITLFYILPIRSLLFEYLLLKDL